MQGPIMDAQHPDWVSAQQLSGYTYHVWPCGCGHNWCSR
jgi:hypothetical protein